MTLYRRFRLRHGLLWRVGHPDTRHILAWIDEALAVLALLAAIVGAYLLAAWNDQEGPLLRGIGASITRPACDAYPPRPAVAPRRTT